MQYHYWQDAWAKLREDRRCSLLLGIGTYHYSELTGELAGLVAAVLSRCQSVAAILQISPIQCKNTLIKRTVMLFVYSMFYLCIMAVRHIVDTFTSLKSLFLVTVIFMSLV